jgi:hypothetical protein
MSYEYELNDNGVLGKAGKSAGAWEPVECSNPGQIISMSYANLDFLLAQSRTVGANEADQGDAPPHVSEGGDRSYLIGSIDEVINLLRVKIAQINKLRLDSRVLTAFASIVAALEQLEKVILQEQKIQDKLSDGFWRMFGGNN